MTEAPDLQPEDFDVYDGDSTVVEPQANGQDAAPPRRLRLIAFRDLQPITVGAYIVKRLIPTEGLAVIWGPPKSGKSFWITDALLHVALGWDYRGRKVRQGAVVYVAAEGGAGFGARKEAFARHHGLPADADPPFFVVAARLELIGDHTKLIAEIQATLGDTRPAVVALDTLNRTIAGSENDPADMGAYVAAADAVRETLKCSVVIVHHCGTEGTRPRGHTSLTGAADCQIAVTRDAAKLVRTTVEWMKDMGGEGDTTTSRLKVIEVGADEDGEPVTSCAIEAADDEETASAPRAKVSGQAKVALNLLHKAINEAGQTPPGSAHRPDNCMSVRESVWRDYCHLGGLTESDKPDTRQKTFVRAKTKLLERQVIGIWEDWVWIV